MTIPETIATSIQYLDWTAVFVLFIVPVGFLALWRYLIGPVGIPLGTFLRVVFGTMFGAVFVLSTSASGAIPADVWVFATCMVFIWLASAPGPPYGGC